MAGEGRKDEKEALRKKWSWKRGDRHKCRSVAGGEGENKQIRVGQKFRMDDGVKGKRWRGGQVDMPYLALHQHGDVYKHVVELFDAALQADDVLVPGFNLTQGLFRDARVHDLCWTQRTGTVNTDAQQKHLWLKQSRAQTLHSTYPCSEDRRVAALQHLLQFFVRRCFPS